MGAFDAFWWAIDRATHEFALFAAVGILIGGIDDLVVDLIWIARRFWRRATIYTRHSPADAETLKTARQPGRIAIFVPAWRESAVIAPMLVEALARFGNADYRIYVGCYPNDRPTIDAVLALAGDPRIRPVVNGRDGPTTKADNLNNMWRALLRDEEFEGRRAKAVVLHDAEDVVHPAEIRLFDRLIERFDLVQLPVLPLIGKKDGWWRRAISSTYADEFCESHGKQLVVREAIGASVPSAGVGCGFSRAALGRIADARGGDPFDADSLTEDYELGLGIGAAGGRGIFVRLPGRRGGGAVSVRAHFPDTLDTAVRQKARWMAGIALSGWDRLGWRGGLAERWMLLRDRRAVLTALVLFAAYAALVGWALVNGIGAPTGYRPDVFSPLELALLQVNLGIMAWRLLMRFAFVARGYGWREGLLSIPRALLGNLVAMLAARKALVRYAHSARGGRVHWDKTDHVFPEQLPAE